MWTEKHKPRRYADVVGHIKAAKDLSEWDGKKPLLISGPTGTGKTLLAEVTAHEKDMELVRLTDENEEQWDVLVQAASLFGGRRLILVDQVDGLGNLKKLAEALAKTRNPVILTTDDPKSKRLTSVKKLCVAVELRRPPSASVAHHVVAVARKEGLVVDADAVKAISEAVGGDVRAAVNDLENVAVGRDHVRVGDVLGVGGRDREKDLYFALSGVFGATSLKGAVEATYDVAEQPDHVLLWIDENVPNVLAEPERFPAVYRELSRADVFLGRIKRRQYWGFLRYANELMTAGVVAHKGKTKFARYQFPSVLIELSRSRGERNLRRGIAGKMGGLLHASGREVEKEYIPLYKTLIKNKKISVEEVAEIYKLDEEEVEYFSD
ncbi:Replication factor C large subunit [uncultured archaeon]|nr:Replication factor C large subunit [uncultured archaeon]